MNATNSRARIELSVPGDDVHVGHRVTEALEALRRIGFRAEAVLEGPVYLLADHEDPVDSTTVDPPAGSTPYQMCGRPSCTHRHDAHDDEGNCGVCNCPGFMPITGGLPTP